MASLKRAAGDGGEGRPGFAGIASVILWAIALGFAAGAAQVARALWSGKVWMNYRGEFISTTEMRHELILLIAVTIVCALLAWYWYRRWRRP